MARSIVLDIDRSIALAERYWQSLHIASEEVWKSYNEWDDDQLKMRLGNSLIYYKDIAPGDPGFRSISHQLYNLEKFRNGYVYDPKVLAQIADYGFELPSRARVAANHEYIQLIDDSMNLIRTVWPAAYAEVQKYMSGIIVIDDKKIYSLSGPTWFGAVFLGVKMLKVGSLSEIANAIIHEVGHLVLCAECGLQSPLTELKERHYSPFKGQERPALLVLHAQMALARMVLWLHHLCDFLKPEERKIEYGSKFSIPLLEEATRSYSRTFIDGMKSVRELTFTDSGRQLLEDFESIDCLLRSLE